jgi:hypothetical protein
MNAYLTRPAAWFCIIMLLSSSQYLTVAISATMHHTPMYWSLPGDELAKVGMAKYYKDLILAIFAVAWPVMVGIRRGLVVYYLWLAGVLVFGLIPYVLGEGYPPLLIAGIRWLIGFHAACGLYVLVTRRGIRPQEERWLLLAVTVVALISCILTALQIRDVGLSQFGKARLPGIFAVGGTNGYFAFGAALIASLCHRRYKWLAGICYALCLFQAAASGTRFAFLGIGFLIYLDLIARLVRLKILKNGFHVLLTHLALLPFGVALGIVLTGVATQRGNLVSDQTGQLGRAASLSDAIDTIKQRGDTNKYAFGAGIGQGTNSAELLIVNSLQRPDWQFQVDNTFVTSFIQFGTVGCIFLFGGILIFLVPRIRSPGYEYFFLVLLAAVTQNLMEQIFMLLPGAVFLGSKVRARVLARYASARSKADGGGGPGFLPPKRATA